HDFIIGARVEATFHTLGSQTIQKEIIDIPAVAIECKTYIDKTMLEGSSTSAEQLKYKNPNGLYMVVSEWIKLTENINLRKYKVDQIYVLRKQKNVDREYRFLPTYTKNPIHSDVVEHLFETVRNHLTADWSGGIRDILVKGYIE
ncbi:MAG TPA: Bpu10I family restriction endonuclease, partial [Verrucomicrobiae bacterium]|nr:Bpu10I family restriction endonuclease [Verrucomicrobiae bacterium]